MHQRLLLCLALIAAAACGEEFADAPFGYDSRPANASCKPPPRPMTTDTGIRLEEVWPQVSFSSPVALLQAPGEGDRFYIVEQSGKIKVLTPGATSASDVLSYPPADISTGG